MKKVILFFLFALLHHFSMADYSHAEKLYNEERYDSALQVYIEAIGNKNNADVFYNIGNCYLHLGDSLVALQYYYKSLKIDQQHKDAKHNAELVCNFYGHEFQESKNGMRNWIATLTQSLPLNFWSYLCIALFNLAIILVLLNRFLWHGRFRLIKHLIFFNVLLSVICFGLSAHTYYSISSVKQALVIDSEAELYNEASGNSTVLVKLKGGILVEIVKENENWYLVRLDKTTSGWLPKEKIGMI